MCVDCNENTSVLPKGDQGNPGQDGSNGVNGNAITQSAGVPSNSDGSNGDSYIDINTYNLYNKQAGVWVLTGNIKGIDGSGLIKLGITYIAPTVTAGVCFIPITGVLLNSLGIPSSSSPGAAVPPPGVAYATSPNDFIVDVYKYLSSTNVWVKIVDTSLTITIDNTSGNLLIQITGLPSSLPIRVLIIG